MSPGMAGVPRLPGTWPGAGRPALLLPLLAMLPLGSSLEARRSFRKTQTKRNSDKPNFVIFFVDDLGYGDVGFTGHPTVSTPNIDRLAFGGKVLTTWYSGCAVCTGSRAALLTGRQYPRTGLPEGIGPYETSGLPLEEVTLAEQLKKVGYATATVGKWHLGQRPVYLPANQGFDYYMGVPYSDDMGFGIFSHCKGKETVPPEKLPSLGDSKPSEADQHSEEEEHGLKRRPKSLWLPLVQQEAGETHVIEQPVDLTLVTEKLNNFSLNFIKRHQQEPFFLYVPFGQVHVTASAHLERQYMGCRWQNSTGRGYFGDALAEVDWVIGNIHQTLKDLGLEDDTLILFAGDNGPYLQYKTSAGSVGTFTGQASGYWNTGKGSTWEGGIREAAFAHWPGHITPFSRSTQVVSSLDVFPTLSALAGVPLQADRVYDGHDMSEILLQPAGRSQHEFLFFYSKCTTKGPSAVRHGRWKAHFCSKPGYGGCEHCFAKVHYSGPKVKDKDPGSPLLFDVETDPGEAFPVQANFSAESRAAMERIMKAYANEVATFVYGKPSREPDGPGDRPPDYGLCCDEALYCECFKDRQSLGLLSMGSRAHHEAYHAILGREAPLPQTPQQHALEAQG